MPETFGLREYHEFEMEEYLEDSPSTPSGDGFIKPFDREAAIDLYIRHLPLEYDALASHPWRDNVWQDPDWMWGAMGLSAKEAMFWFMAMTLPQREQDTQLEAPGADTLRALDLDALLSEVDLHNAAARLREWFELLQRRRGEVRWFTYAYMSRLLTEIFSCRELLELLFMVIPGAEVRHFFAHIRVGEDALKDETLRASIVRHVEMIPLERGEEDAYIAVRLLEKFPVEEAALAMCERLDALEERSGFLVRDAVNLLQRKEDFVFWFNRMSDYHIAREAIPTLVLRAGMEVVHALTLRVVQQPDEFLSVAFKDLLRLHTWRAVDGMLVLVKRPPFGRAARDWLVSNAVHAVYRLLPLWLSSASAGGEERALVQGLLEEICARGHADVLNQFAAERSEEERARIQEVFADYELEII